MKYFTDNILQLTEPLVTDPCTPNPCGPNSICRADGTTAHCSCRPAMRNDPPACKPQCRINSDCAQHQACRNQRCVDPCPGVCGAHATCHVRLHVPICTCPPRFTGDPFVRCLPGKLQHYCYEYTMF